MKIAVLVYAHKDVGLGHWNRSVALIKELERRGHMVWVLGNMMVHRKMYFQVREGNEIDLYHVMEQLKPDVFIADLQDEIPDYVYNLVGEDRLVVLNGVGREREYRAGMVFIQGYTNSVGENIFSGPEYVILRPELERDITGPVKEWFVWGGAKDKMRLSQVFQKVFPESETNILMTQMSTTLDETYRTMFHEIFLPKSLDDHADTFIRAIKGTRKACIAMGMAAWETTTLGIPTYAFSSTEGHLAFAKKMESEGLLRAWNGVGLPSLNEMAEFLSQDPIVPSVESRADFMGASRVADRLEEHYGKK